jgi:carbamoylphosphate synthase large subunit
MKTILFGPKPEWVNPIQTRLDPAKFRGVFRELDDNATSFDEFDCVIPLRLEDYEPLRARLKNGHTKFLIPSEDVVALAHDKSKWNEFLQNNGFGQFVPEIYDDYVFYPFIYKKRQDDWGSNSRIIYSPEEASAFEHTINRDEYFKQEYVIGNIEYVVHILAVEGRVRYALCYEHGFDSAYFIKGKWASYTSWRELETPFMEVFASILEKLNYTGTCCFNYKIANGVPKIFEMNPRYGWTLTLEVNAYLDAYLNALAA